jgi:hypothetical protein
VYAVSELEVEPQGEPQSEPTAGEPTPDELGLVVTSIVVGPRSRLATMNGQVFRQGETIRVALGASLSTAGGGSNNKKTNNRQLGNDSDTANGPSRTDTAPAANVIEFVLADVHPDYVRLVRQQKSYQLKLQRRELASRQTVIGLNGAGRQD